MTLKEISFVEFGADPNTSATIEAIAITGEKNNLFTNKEKTMELKTNESTVEAQKVETPAVHLSATGAIDEYRKLIAEERNRVSQIGLIGGGTNMAMETQAIAEGWTAQRFELELLRASRPAAPPVHSTAEQINEKALEVIALSAAGIASSQLEKRFDPQTLEMSDRFRGMGLQEFCEVACGQRLPRFQRDAHGWLEAAFSTTSLPGILSNVANKMLLDGYNYVEDAWRKVCKIASVTDFKQHKRYRMTGSFKFEPVGPQGELKHGVIGEQEYTQQADTHGIMFALTRKMIIDDDLGALTDIPRQVGMGAAEAIADAVWELLLANPQQRDGKAFFSAEHKNLLTGVDSKLSINGLTNAEVRFGQQTKPTVATDNKRKERPLGIMPSILLVPIAQKVIAEMLMKATTVNETTKDGQPVPNTNPHAGKYEIVSSTYLSSSAIAGSSANAWYLMADPNRLPSLEVAFLGGVDRPTIERADADFDKLGIQFRGYIDFGVKEQDHRGMLKVTGE